MEILKKAAVRLVLATRPVRYWLEDISYSRYADSSWLSQWKDRYRGRPMLVVGNGPSLNQTPLHEFAHLPSIGMNKIDLLFPRTTWRPTAILCANDLVVRQHWKAWLDLKLPVLLSWKTRRQIPAAHRDEFEYFLTLSARKFRTDLPRGIGLGHSVTYMALQFAYHCGADPVIVFGVDHSFVQHSPVGSYEMRRGPDVNHFDPNYFPAGQRWGVANIPEIEMDYRRALAAYQAGGRRVFDATIGGKLQVFPKISLDEARSIAGTAGSKPPPDRVET